MVHDLKRGPHIRREVGLVDHKYVALRDAGAILARNLVAGGHINHIDEEVDQRGREGKRQIVASRLDEHDVGIRKLGLHLLDSRDVHRRVFADSRMRTRASLHADDAVFGQHPLQDFADMLGILRGDDVVCDDQHLVTLVDKTRGYGFNQGGLSRTNGSSDTDSTSTHIGCVANQR